MENSRKKRVMLVESSSLNSGHHLAYIKALLKIVNYDFVVVCPSSDISLPCDYIHLEYRKGFVNYLRWLKRIQKMVFDKKIDLVLFLYGDVFYRYFGMGLHIFKNIPVLMTFHGVKEGRIRMRSYRSILKKINFGVVHTQKIQKYLTHNRIKNVCQIEYPKIDMGVRPVSKNDARDFFGINEARITLLALGGMRYDKGVDILIDAVNSVSTDVCCLIAGSYGDFSQTDINRRIQGNEEKYILYPKYLSEEEIAMAVEAADILVLPYRKMFDGASGPLVEGVWRHKMIIGPDHGSLGDIISSNDLGYTFMSENVDDLRNSIEKAIRDNWIITGKYEEYKDRIDEENFSKNYKLLFDALFQ